MNLRLHPWAVALVGLVASGTLGCGGDREPPVAQSDAVPATVETLAPDVVVAGETIVVDCTADPGTFDEGLTGLTPTIRVVPEGSVALVGGTIEARRAGTVEVSCTFPEADLVDTTPALVTIAAGPPARVSTTVNTTSLTAGGAVLAGCRVVDAFDNVVDGAAPELSVLPDAPGTDVTDLAATLTRTGVYALACHVPGATGAAVSVEVVPAAPDALQMGLSPDLPYYSPGQSIVVTPRLTDAFGNLVRERMPTLVSVPPGLPAGPLAVRYLADGDYVLRLQDPPLEASAVVRVDGSGPVVVCDAPFDGEMIEASPGASIAWSGTVTDANDVAAVTVDGAPAVVEADGSFTVDVTARFGHNFVDVVATDGLGVERAHTCSFLAAPSYQGEDEGFADAVTLALFQDAIDDGDRTGPPTSLGDLLAAVVDDTTILEALDAALLEANPLKDSCDQEFAGFCIFESRLDYRSAAIGGPNTTSLQLVDGGLETSVVLRDLSLVTDLSGTLDTSLTVRFAAITLGIDFDVFLDGDGPGVAVRGSDVALSGLDVDLGGVPDFLEGILLALFRDTIQDLVEDLVRDQLLAQFETLLDELVGSLDLSGFGTTVEIPTLDGAGSVPLTFGLDFTALDVTPDRMRFGLGTALFAESGIATPSPGVALPEGPALADPVADGQTAAAAIHVGLLNQALHALWRAGLFAGELRGDALGLPSGLTASLRTTTPPVAELAADRTTIGVGPLFVDVAWPDLLDDPLAIGIGARAGASVAVEDGEVVFGDVVIEELHLTTESVSLEPGTRTALEDFARRLVQALLDTALDGALPAVPIPSFEIPAEVGELGLPAGAELTIGAPRLDNEPPHIVLSGSLEVLP